MAEKKKIVLSYIMTTFNKLGFLKITLPLLIAACKPDEEIVIADGGSTDGTREYLEELHRDNKIHKFISEKDFGEAHGTNKAILLSEGELVKLITDDDIYHYPTVNACKQYMLSHKEYDILGFDGFGLNLNHSNTSFEKSEHIIGFKKWKTDHSPFLFCGLSYMMRRSSFALMGLFNTNFKIVDIEYSIRVSSMKTNIAFYTGLGYVNIVNPQSNSHKFYRAIDEEKKKLFNIYPELKSTIGTRSLSLKTREYISEKILKRKPKNSNPFDYEKTVREAIDALKQFHEGKTFDFI